MNPADDRELVLFREALQRAAGPERDAFLDQACAGDAQLRARIDALVQAHETPDPFLEPLASPPSATGTLRPEEGPGTVIGRYKLLQQIGEGGCGVVYMAEQEVPMRRRVALKIIKLGMDTKQVVARFEAERQALAMMDHPNIARVLDGGATEAGRPYFVLELVRGVRITDYCDQNNLPTVERLNLFLQVCHAIQHAHQKGVIHRDIKPSNILVSLHDDVPVAKVIDFGIAKAMGERLTDKTVVTRFEQFIGTPAYMSPEQAGVSGLDIDTRSDIYALGVLLYELLTGRTPFDPKQLKQAGLEEVLRRIREEEPPKPSTRLSTLAREELTTTAARRQTEPPKLIGLLRGDLDWIVMKCLEKTRARRYETANALAQDIEHHLNHEPVMAAAPTALYRAGKFVRRHKAGLATATGLMLLLAAGVVVSTWQTVRATRAERAQSQLRQHAEAEKERADAHAKQVSKEKEIARFNLYVANIRLAQQELENRRSGSALSLLEAQRPKNGEEDLRGFEWYYLWRQCNRGLLATLRGHEQRSYALAFSSDGTSLVAASPDGTVTSWALGGAWEQQTLGDIRGRMSSVAFSRDGKLLAWGDTTGIITIWDVSARAERVRIKAHSSRVLSLAFSPDSRRLASGGGLMLRVWEVDTGEAVGPGWEHVWTVRRVAFSADGQLVAGTEYGTVKVYDLATRQLRQTLARHRFWIASLAFFPDGKTLVSGGNNATIKFWDLASGKERAAERAADVDTLAVSPDGRRLATGSDDGTVEVRDLSSGLVRSYAHTNRVCALAFSPDGSRLASASLDGTIKLWDLRSAADLPPAKEQENLVWFVVFSPQGKLLVSSADSGPIRLSDVGTGQELTSLPNGALAAAFSPDGKTLAISMGDSVGLWDVATWQQRGALEGHKSGVFAVRFSSDAKTLASATESGTVYLWDLATRRTRAVMEGSHPKGQVWSVAFSPDGAWLASAGGEYCGYGEALLWDVATGQKRAVLPRGTTCVEFSPDGKTLASGLLGGSVGLWDPITGRAQAEISGHVGITRVMAFSPDGQTLASCNTEGSVTIWDTARRQQRATLREDQRSIWALAFSPDGRTLATGGADGGVELWRAADEREVTECSPLFDQLIELGGQSSWQGTLLRERGQNAEAREAYSNSAALYESAAAQFPGRSEYKQPLAAAYWRLSRLLADSDQSATQDCSRGLTFADKAMALCEGDTHALPQRAAIACDKARLLAKAGRTEEALAAFNQAIEWGRADTNRCASILTEARLSRGGLLQRMNRFAEAAADRCEALSIPRRDAQAGTNLVDLSAFYNAALEKECYGKAGDNLAALPKGVQTFAQVQFDIRGLVQLAGTDVQARLGGRYPDSIAGVPIRRKFTRLSMLHGTRWSEEEGRKIGACILHYADGRQVELPIVYGEDVRDWWLLMSDRKDVTQATVAWTGRNSAIAREKGLLRLFKRTWDNPRPDVEVESIDFTSTVTRCAPFLIALTVE